MTPNPLRTNPATAQQITESSEGVGPTPVVVVPPGILERRIIEALRANELEPSRVLRSVEEALDPPPELLLISSGRGMRARDDQLRRVRHLIPEAHLILIPERYSRLSVRAALDVGAGRL